MSFRFKKIFLRISKAFYLSLFYMGLFAAGVLPVTIGPVPGHSVRTPTLSITPLSCLPLLEPDPKAQEKTIQAIII